VIELSKKSKIPLHHGRLDLPGTPPSGFGVQGTVKVTLLDACVSVIEDAFLSKSFF
jgi:hypothetical protein